LSFLNFLSEHALAASVRLNVDDIQDGSHGTGIVRCRKFDIIDVGYSVGEKQGLRENDLSNKASVTKYNLLHEVSDVFNDTTVNFKFVKFNYTIFQTK